MVGQSRLVFELVGHLADISDRGCNHWLGLHGMRGLGKTLLCKALCARLERQYPTRTCLLQFPTLHEPAPEVIERLRRGLIEDAQGQLGMKPNARQSLVRPARAAISN